MVSLRTATPGDQDTVTQLLRMSYGRLMPAAYGDALMTVLLPVITKANPDLLASGRYYLAETSDGLVVGCGGWTRERPGTGEVEAGLGHIRHVATHPERTGQGIGRALVDRCVIDGRAAGVRRFECYASLNAVDFYASLGFVEIRPIDVSMGDDRVMPSFLMERSL